MTDYRDLSGNGTGVGPFTISRRGPVSFVDLGMIPNVSTTAVVTENQRRLLRALTERNELIINEGIWYFQNSLNLAGIDNLVLAGAGSKKTYLHFLHDKTYTAGESLWRAYINIGGASFAAAQTGVLLEGFTITTEDITHSIVSIEHDGVGTATVVTRTAHNFNTGDSVRVSSVTQADYNITATITVTGDAEFEMPVPGTPVTPATFGINRAVATKIATNAAGIDFSYLVDSNFNDIGASYMRTGFAFGVDVDNVNFDSPVLYKCGRGITYDGGSNSKVRSPLMELMRDFGVVWIGNDGDPSLGSESDRPRADAGGNSCTDGIFINAEYTCVDVNGSDNNRLEGASARGFTGIAALAAFQMKNPPLVKYVVTGNRFTDLSVEGFHTGAQAYRVGGGSITNLNVKSPATDIAADPKGLYVLDCQNILCKTVECREYDAVDLISGKLYGALFESSADCQLNGLHLDVASGATTTNIIGLGLTATTESFFDNIDTEDAATPFTINSTSSDNQFGLNWKLGTVGPSVANTTNLYPFNYEHEFAADATGKFYLPAPSRGLWLGEVEAVMTVASSSNITLKIGTAADDDKFVTVANGVISPTTVGAHEKFAISNRSMPSSDGGAIVEITVAGSAGSRISIGMRGFPRML